MKIAEIQAGTVGQRATGFTVNVKTFKKIWQVGDEWFQQVILCDETGEIPADVKLGKAKRPNTRPSLQGNKTLTVIACELQESEYMGKPCKKLYIDEYSVPTITADDYNKMQEDEALEYRAYEEHKIRGMIRHGLVCSMIKAQFNPQDILKNWQPTIKELVEFIFSGDE